MSDADRPRRRDASPPGVRSACAFVAIAVLLILAIGCAAEDVVSTTGADGMSSTTAAAGTTSLATEPDAPAPTTPGDTGTEGPASADAAGSTDFCTIVVTGLVESGPGDDPGTIRAVLEDARKLAPPELVADLDTMITGFEGLDEYRGDEYWDARYRLSDDPAFIAAAQALDDYMTVTCDPALLSTTTMAPDPDGRFRPVEPGEGIEAE